MQHLCKEGGFADVPPVVEIAFGLAAHFKNAADGQQAHLRAALDEAAKVPPVIADIESFITRTSKIFAEGRDLPGENSRMPASFHHFFPDQSKADFIKTQMYQFAGKSFVEQIGVCQCWQLRLHDIRRRWRPLYKNRWNVLTALNFSASMLQGHKTSVERTVLPQLVECTADGAAALAEAEAEAEADGGAPVAAEPGADAGAPVLACGAEEALMSQKEQNGWLISYRTSQPEKKEFVHWRRQFSKQRQRFQGMPLQAARSRRPMAEQLERQKIGR